MHICIFEDNRFTNFLPLVHFRPSYELRCGILSLREKIQCVLREPDTALHVRTLLAESFSEQCPGTPVNTLPHADTWFINGRILADDRLLKIIKSHKAGAKVLIQEGQVAAAFVPGEHTGRLARYLAGQPITGEAFEGYPQEPFQGTMLNYPWDLVHNTPDEIEKDFRRLAKKRVPPARVYPGAHLLDRKNIRIGRGSVIKPGAVIDAEKGPVFIGSNVTVMPNAVIEGPAYIGDRSTVKIGAKIYHGTSIGNDCKVGGEVESSIIHSYSNKQHEGFLGHSYLSSWVNIGADTNTSDLKNTYGTVRVHVNGELIDTGMQFVGLTMGDHSKSGINCMFDTGTVVGVSCNIYGAGLPPKFVPAFSWGSEKSYSEYNLEKGLETARRVMQRRGIAMSPAYEKLFRSVFTLTQPERQGFVIPG